MLGQMMSRLLTVMTVTVLLTLLALRLELRSLPQLQ